MKTRSHFGRQAVQIQNFQDFIIALCEYWTNYGCIWSQPYDAQMGAGTFHPHTFLRGIGPEPWRSVYVQPCRRPVDGRYGKSPYRFQHYYQLQVLLKPSPANIVDIFLKSLEHVGISLQENDIGLLEDDWKGPTLGAWGLGWEVRANGQEVTQFTYFQQLGGLDVDVICGEITYGLERLFMYAKGIKNGLDIPFNEHFSYGDIYLQNEYEFSFFNFKEASVQALFYHFEHCETTVSALCEKGLVLPAYDYTLQASHAFNLLDARGAISATERQRFIGRVRDCARKCALKYLEGRQKLNFPLLNRIDSDARKPLYSKQDKKIDLQLPSEKNKYVGVDDFSQQKNLSVLFELGVEEMPADFQRSAREEIQQKWSDFIARETNKFQSNSEFLKDLQSMECVIDVSARRISVSLQAVPKMEPDVVIEIWGPHERVAKAHDGSLSQAGSGFCKKNQLDPNQVAFRERADGVFIYAKKEQKGADLPTILAKEFKEWCYALSAPIKMKWLPLEVSPAFIRPVRWIVALAEDKVIPLNMFGIESGRNTCGQRILSPHFTPISHAQKYAAVLKENHVVPFTKDRRDLILKRANELISEKNGKLLQDDGLLDKCVGLYENPYVFMAEFDKKFLSLPQKLVRSVLKEHMNYFSVVNDKGDLLPWYIGASHYPCKKLDNMVAGTKDVVVGRLEDGAFYYEQDLATPLAELKEKLKNQVFQNGMGSLYDKTERNRALCRVIYGELKDTEEYRQVDPDVLDKSAEFCKADLRTGCVQEFPDEMQGVMGAILVESQNVLKDPSKSKLAAVAIEDHYQPSGVNSPLPRSIYAVLLSIVDKMDSLCMMLNAGLEVKGNKDPLGMRRLAISLMRLLGAEQKSNAFPLSFQKLFSLWAQSASSCGVTVQKSTQDRFESFVLERVKSFLKEKFDARAVDSLSAKMFISPLDNMVCFLKILSDTLSSEKEKTLFTAAFIPYKRAKNILQTSGSGLQKDSVQSALFSSVQEKNLWDSLLKLEKQVQEQFKTKNYVGVLHSLSEISKPLAEFFEAVMVNDPNPQMKANRIALLARICDLYDEVADFNLL